MLTFKPISEILTDEPVNTQEDFNNCEYAGVDALLNVKNYEDLLFVTEEEDDAASEAYWFLEANANHVERRNNFLLVELDEIKYVLIEFPGIHTIAIHKNSKTLAEDLL